MIPIGSKPVNLAQLSAEMQAAGVDIGKGLGVFDGWLYRLTNGTPGVDGTPARASAFADEPAAQAVLDAHAALRPLSDSEITVMYAEANDKQPQDTATMQKCVAMMQGLVPRDLVPME